MMEGKKQWIQKGKTPGAAGAQWDLSAFTSSGKNRGSVQAWKRRTRRGGGNDRIKCHQKNPDRVGTSTLTEKLLSL